MQTDQLLDPSAGEDVPNNQLTRGRHLRLELDFPESKGQMSSSKLETTGYVAWADALGRAGVRFSELPEDARQRLNHWLTLNASTPTRTAPKIALGWPGSGGLATGRNSQGRVAVSFEAEPAAREHATEIATPATVEYEFNSLGTDLAATLRLIAERARALTRGTSAAVALAHKDNVLCRASVGANAPPLGAPLDVNSGISGDCLREAHPVRCDDAEHDPRVDLAICRKLAVRSIVAAPIRYERATVGLLMVFSTQPFNFDEGDIAVVSSLAHTVLRCLRQSEVGKGGALAG